MVDLKGWVTHHTYSIQQQGDIYTKYILKENIFLKITWLPWKFAKELFTSFYLWTSVSAVMEGFFPITSEVKKGIYIYILTLNYYPTNISVILESIWVCIDSHVSPWCGVVYYHDINSIVFHVERLILSTANSLWCDQNTSHLATQNQHKALVGRGCVHYILQLMSYPLRISITDYIKIKPQNKARRHISTIEYVERWHFEVNEWSVVMVTSGKGHFFMYAERLCGGRGQHSDV